MLQPVAETAGVKAGWGTYKYVCCESVSRQADILAKEFILARATCEELLRLRANRYGARCYYVVLNFLAGVDTKIQKNIGGKRCSTGGSESFLHLALLSLS